jgi:hypothetical protein
LPLSHQEKISLSAFTDEDLDFAIWKSQTVFELKSLSAYLFKVCFDRCKENGTKPDWALVERLKEVDKMLTKLEGPVMQRIQRNTEDEDVDCLEQRHTVQDFKKEPQQVRNSPRILNLTPTPTRKPIEEIKSRPERLMSRSEYNMAVKNLMDKPDFFTNISREVLKNKQRALYDQLSPEQQEAWRKGL